MVSFKSKNWFSRLDANAKSKVNASYADGNDEPTDAWGNDWRHQN